MSKRFKIVIGKTAFIALNIIGCACWISVALRDNKPWLFLLAGLSGAGAIVVWTMTFLNE